MEAQAPLFAIILATLAAQIMIEQIIILTDGDQPRTYHGFSLGGPLKLGSDRDRLPAVLDPRLRRPDGRPAAHAFFDAHPRRARVARLLAEPRSRGAARHSGQPHADAVVRALSAALGAVAGILVTPTQYTAFNVGVPFGINGFIAAIIGGFGSASGALAGGVLLGAVQALAIVIVGAGYKNVVALSVLLLVLLVFPSGVFGGLGKRV